MKRKFTGRHMTLILVAGFGVVIAVNLLMATLAVRSFGGVVVENSYVASQKFNGWLDAAERGRALGWDAQITRNEDGKIVVKTNGVPAGSQVSADIRRPLGQPNHEKLSFLEAAPGSFVSKGPAPQGRWIVRLTVVSDKARWVVEGHIA